MTETNHITSLDSGIAVIHSNKLEELGGVVEYWLREHPLAPLENEVFLVQSNGMGQWLQQRQMLLSHCCKLNARLAGLLS